ncbi:carbohydrate ABC transporter substrate-binding protein (CUT1 family) [Promicromonospora sp. AC04]|uniref:extracellular solute-binding protein n=1 Tax=Promicromonospora sp. AC04 TaxID=2135723 RepID=UPI000D3546FD|nr:extracellular solute-binding protein [Promicromonospora sp. AC04]PUB32046.1 carbohydrate ABC transporter substrate-binding protein (CUT1 family) [Promicromonospora sp. AC04]
MPLSRHLTARLTAGAAVISLLALSGCGRSDEPASAAASARVDDGPATGTVELWAPDGDATALDDVLASFKKDNPDLDLQVTLVPADEYTTKLQSAVASGAGPDVAQLYTESQAQFTVGGAFAPVPEGLVDSASFFPGSWESGVVDGVAYSVPWYAYTYALVYRSDFAEAAGVAAPTTWDDAIPFFEALQDGGAEKGLGADVGWDVYNGQDVTQYLWQAGGSPTSDDGAEWTLDTPEMVDALTYNQSFFTSGVADPDAPGFLDSQPYFVQGKTGAMMTGPWVIGQLDDVAGEEGWTQEHVATAPLPGDAGGSVGAVAGGSWGVLANSDNADASWKVVRELAVPETQVAQYEAMASLPAVRSAWDDPAIADQPLLDAFFEQLQSAETYPQAQTWAQIATQLGVEMEAVAKGSQTPEQAAAAIQSFAESLGTGAEQ